jgi:hypothetical protein
VNGFDESFTGWGHEDSDLVVRLFHAGRDAQGRRLCHRGVPPVAPEAAERDQESSNRGVVLERAASKVTQATVGLREHAN